MVETNGELCSVPSREGRGSSRGSWHQVSVIRRYSVKMLTIYTVNYRKKTSKVLLWLEESPKLKVLTNPRDNLEIDTGPFGASN